ncbi:MAG: hypothetical protein IKA03_01065 [Alphaproteobacteria bacterium]|nr:hypothetical protein [Alphaproteobacteria bacterium]
MVKKQASDIQTESPKKSGGFKRIVFRLCVLAIVAGVGYGAWKNPQMLEQIKGMFENKPKEDVYQPQINSLKSQMQKLQMQLAQVSSQIKEPDLSDVHDKMAAIEKLNLNVIDSKADVAAVLGVITRMDKVEQKLGQALAVTDESALILTAAMLVKDAAERGGNFEYEAGVLNNLVGNNPKFMAEAQKIEKFAKKGIVSELVLVQEFDKLYEGILVKQKEDFSKNWKERLNNKIQEIVKIKKTNVEEPGFVADEGLAKVKALVDAGKIKVAVKEIAILQNDEWVNNTLLQEWIAKVKDRQEFYAAIRSISAQSLAAMKVKFLKPAI